jgi:hypothetical protein
VLNGFGDPAQIEADRQAIQQRPMPGCSTTAPT